MRGDPGLAPRGDADHKRGADVPSVQSIAPNRDCLGLPARQERGRNSCDEPDNMRIVPKVGETPRSDDAQPARGSRHNRSPDPARKLRSANFYGARIARAAWRRGRNGGASALMRSTSEAMRDRSRQCADFDARYAGVSDLARLR